MGKVLVIGCGGVAGVAIQKCAQNDAVFDEICIASRTVSKCDALKEKLEGKTKAKITTAQVDADNVPELVELIKKVQPDVVLNLALPVSGSDNHGSPAWKPAYTMWTQQTMSRKIRQSLNINGSGRTARNTKKQESQPFLEVDSIRRVTSVFSAYALKHYFDEINYIDILDCKRRRSWIPRSQPTLTRRSISGKCPQKAPTGRMDTG